MLPADASPEPDIRLTEQESLAAVAAVLQLCAAGRLRCSEKTRRPSAATVTAVAEVLPAGDFYADQPITAFAWPLLLQAGGLAEQAASRLQLTTRGLAALTAPAAGTIRHLWRRWVSHGVIDEMSRVDEVKGQRVANVLTAVKPRRQAVAAALAACPPGEWIGVDELFARVRRRGMSIARNERAQWRLYIADPEYGSFGYDYGRDRWPLLAGRYTLCVLFEYAATLGLVDVDYTDPVGARDDYRDMWGGDFLDYLSRYDGLRAVRLNSLGAYAVGLTTGYEANGATRRTLKVLPNLDVVATGDVPAADRLVLDAFAAPMSDRVWSLSAASLLAALDAGRALEELRGFLAARTLTELPGTVTRLIDDVAGRASGVCDLGVVQLVECADATLATLVARDRTLRPLCRPVGDRHLAVPPEHVAGFRKALRALGYVLG